MFAGENIGKFSKLMVNCQRFLPQIYGIFSIHVLCLHHSTKFSLQNNLNNYIFQCFLPPTFFVNAGY